MNTQECMTKFVESSFEHLITKMEGFKNKLEKGDLTAIKLLIDLSIKVIELNKKIDITETAKDEVVKELDPGETSYETFFKHFKDNVGRQINDP